MHLVKQVFCIDPSHSGILQDKGYLLLGIQQSLPKKC